MDADAGQVTDLAVSDKRIGGDGADGGIEFLFLLPESRFAARLNVGV